ncbi:MAG TPA: fibronectin type III domain-containing protein, partial [Candidatus Kapabacteria bacterium]|nr:fibronectin type III domain-containing protein [Candidatus Kapabacteria bacterium]
MKRFTSCGLSLAAMMTYFFIVCSAAFAQDIPLVPKNYSASVSGTTIYAMWQKNPEGPEATGYKVYIAKGETEDLSKFDLVATVTKPIDGEKYKYAIEKLSPGTYTVIVRAFNDNGEGNRTSIKVLTIKESSEGNGLVFKSTPKKEAGVNSEYV